MSYVGKDIRIDLKICIGRLPVPTIVKPNLYERLVSISGSAFPTAKVLACNVSEWKVVFENGSEGFIPKSRLLEIPPGVSLIEKL